MAKQVTATPVEILKTSALLDGQMLSVDVAGRALLVARVAGKFYAADDRCPHMGGNLAKGYLEGTVVTCPVHASQFDLTDGHVVRWTNWSGVRLAMGKVLRSPRPLKTYPVTMEGDRLLVQL